MRQLNVVKKPARGCYLIVVLAVRLVGVWAWCAVASIGLADPPAERSYRSALMTSDGISLGLMATGAVMIASANDDSFHAGLMVWSGGFTAALLASPAIHFANRRYLRGGMSFLSRAMAASLGAGIGGALRSSDDPDRPNDPWATGAYVGLHLGLVTAMALEWAYFATVPSPSPDHRSLRALSDRPSSHSATLEPALLVSAHHAIVGVHGRF